MPGSDVLGESSALVVTSWPSTTPSIWRASGLDGALSQMQTPPIAGMKGLV